jgi:hypothetical protein
MNSDVGCIGSIVAALFGLLTLFALLAVLDIKRTLREMLALMKAENASRRGAVDVHSTPR